MNAEHPFTDFNFAKVMNYPENRDDLFVFDFADGYDSDFIRSKQWGIGKYDERRADMYTAPQYDSIRNIHIGIDIWARAGEPVFTFYEGHVAYMQNNDQFGDYGPAIVVKYNLQGRIYFALYGHLSVESLDAVSKGQKVNKGQPLGRIGTENENGGWAPHLHFQLSTEDPGKADMPGVVDESFHPKALNIFPDPRLVLGELY